MKVDRPVFEREMHWKRRLWSGKHKGRGKDEGQRGVGREEYERTPWLLGRHGEKLNNSARTVSDALCSRGS
jgi:hypothetical protein